jgi:hypothetical protein
MALVFLESQEQFMQVLQQMCEHAYVTYCQSFHKTAHKRTAGTVTSESTYSKVKAQARV